MTAPDGVRGRHPAARARADHLVRMGAAVAGRSRDMAGPHRSVAAATLAVRGGQGRSITAFASAYGIDIAVVEAMEAGHVDRGQVPAPLQVLTPLCALAEAVGRAVEGTGESSQAWPGGLASA